MLSGNVTIYRENAVIKTLMSCANNRNESLMKINFDNAAPIQAKEKKTDNRKKKKKVVRCS